MADHTKIEWADATVNFWAGCTKVSPACDNCYAEKMASRLWGLKWGPGERRQHFLGAVETLAKLDRKAQKLGTLISVFINSLSDLFDNEVNDADRMDAFEAMAMFRNLVFLVLTKRIGNVRPYTQRDSLAFDLISDGRVWLGITVCNQEEADRDIPKLLAVPAAKRFLSMEPLLGPVYLGLCDCDHGSIPAPNNVGGVTCPKCNGTGGRVVDWVIVGGESGPNARPMHPDWARSLRDQCQAAGVPFMFKQWGEYSGDPAMLAEPRKWTMVDRDGKTLASAGSTANMGPITHVAKVGKMTAGRLLDGLEHNGRPA